MANEKDEPLLDRTGQPIEFDPLLGLPRDTPPGRHPFDPYLISLERMLGRNTAARYLRPARRVDAPGARDLPKRH